MQTSSDHCYHCGEAIPNGLNISLIIENKARFFCCHGCSAVAQMITENGMEGFYKHRSQLSITPQQVEEATQSELKTYDNPDLQSEFVFDYNNSESATKLKQATLIIEGITCAACIWLLEKHINSNPAVSTFTVNHTTQRATLCWSPSEEKLSEILLMVYQLGYKAHPYKANKEEEILVKERKKAIFRLGVAGFAMMQNMMFAIPLYVGMVSGISDGFLALFRWVSLLVTTPVVFYAARPFFQAAIRDIKTRHLTMDVPVSLAIGIAYLSSAYITIFGGEDVYFDSVAMFTFFLLLGRFLEAQARLKSGQSIASLINLIPPSAIKMVNGNEEIVSVKALSVGDLIRVKPASLIPADGIIQTGQSSIDESALTGEFMPVNKQPGDSVTGGTSNVENPLDITITAIGANARISSIMRLLDRAQTEKPAVALLADKVASYFVAAVLIITASVFTFWWFHEPDSAFSIALSVLVVTCPCALSLATPTALTAATSFLRSKGFLITRGHVLESLAMSDELIFDKTGTLTKGQLTISQIISRSNFTNSELISLASSLEQHSEHPIAKVFKSASPYSAQNIISTPGGGIEASINNNKYRIGHIGYAAKLLGKSSAEKSLQAPDKGHWLALVSEEQLLGWFLIEDTIREESHSVIKTLKHLGYNVSLLSGDQSQSVFTTATTLGINNAIGGASPEDKLKYMQKQHSKNIIMVGDGLNDVPVMAGTQLSIAMGNANDLTKMKADAILLSSNLETLLLALKTGKRTRKIIRQNLSWAIAYNLVALPLAASGMIPPYAAAIGMSASSLIVVCNAIRLNKPIK